MQPSPFDMPSIAIGSASSRHVTMISVTEFLTLLAKPLIQLMCVMNPQYSHAVPWGGQRKMWPRTKIHYQQRRTTYWSVTSVRMVQTVFTRHHKMSSGDRAEKKSLQGCLQQRWHFLSFVTPVDGLLGVEAAATLKRISNRLATKWQKPYFKTCGYVKISISITLVQATHRCIRGGKVSAHKTSVQLPQYKDGAEINLFI